MSTLKSRMFARFPRVAAVNRILRGPQVSFSGWGMTTTTTKPPWTEPQPGSVAEGFTQVDATLMACIESGAFVPSQYADQDSVLVMQGLRWRHYFVYWSALLAARRTKGQVTLAECGVCDGLTIFYALSATQPNGRAFLYDAWATLASEKATESEKFQAGDYEYLSVDRTKQNLAPFAANVEFNIGYIPESFGTSVNPDTVDWLHIDLNAAKPTRDALEFFFSRLSNGAVVLFDDYAHNGYEDTRQVTDKFFRDTDMQVMHLPTGQALAMRV